MQQEITNLVQWLQTKVKQANAQGLVVGLSGGIDSAVVAALIKQAFPNDSLGIIIPIKSNPQDVVDAKLVAERIGLAHYEIDLSHEHHQMLDKSYPQLELVAKAELRKQITDANLRARLRMTVIYTAANALNYLVMGTDNKAEYYTGYFTKHGDGACDLLPLLEFTKGEVTQMAQLLKLPPTIIEKTPSAGLWDGQTDEAELGVSYHSIDAYLSGKEIPENDLKIIQRLHSGSHHKRSTPPGYQRK